MLRTNFYTKKYDTQILAVEIISDHVHLFLCVKPNVVPSQIGFYLKGWASRMLRQEFPFFKSH
ncbi:MAG: transposase [Candidatus Hermodarchaeota archaeon]